MSDIKITTHIHHTYETPDGREFYNKKEAMEWLKHLCNLEDMRMLDNDHKPTDEIECADYVYAKTAKQAESFNAIQEYNGYAARLPSAGFYYYDEIADGYVDIESEIEQLQRHMERLKGGAE